MAVTITTFDRVPDFVVGHARDLRVRWACEEAGIPYDVDTVSIVNRSAAHLARQPFGLVPILRDGDREIFESGAILCYLGEKSGTLLPADPGDRAEVMQWTFAALNTLETAVGGLVLARFFDNDDAASMRAARRVSERIARLAPVFGDGRDFIAVRRFTIADILMTEVLRITERLGFLAPYPAISAYLEQMTRRPGFVRAHAAQLDHFANGGTIALSQRPGGAGDTSPE